MGQEFLKDVPDGLIPLSAHSPGLISSNVAINRLHRLGSRLGSVSGLSRRIQVRSPSFVLSSWESIGYARQHSVIIVDLGGRVAVGVFTDGAWFSLEEVKNVTPVVVPLLLALPPSA